MPYRARYRAVYAVWSLDRRSHADRAITVHLLAASTEITMMCTPSRMAALLVPLIPLHTATAAAATELSVTTVLHGNPNARSTECQSFWSPLLLHTNTNTTVLIAMCKRGQGSRAAPFVKLIQSKDSGRTWLPQIDITNQTLGQFAYSRTSSKIVMLVGMQDECGNSCRCAMIKHCNQTASRGATCAACEKANAKAMENGGCTASELSRFCAPPTEQQAVALDPVAIPGMNRSHGDLVWAKDLPTPSATRLERLRGAVITSSDDGRTWTAPERPIQVNGSIGPHYIGGGINHGLELQQGQFAGRLVFARRFDGALRVPGDPDDLTPYMRSFVLFSDDGGATFQVGQLLPASWTECEVAELRNGSLLMTSRIEGCVAAYGRNTSSCGHERGFARSDDGGYSWAEVWFLGDRQPNIPVAVADHALCSDPSFRAGTVFWSHPGNIPGSPSAVHWGSRSNYTLHRSPDGATWKFVTQVYADGAGYSDAIVLPDPQDRHSRILTMAFQKTFHPPRHGIEGGGYDIGLALLPLKSDDRFAHVDPTGRQRFTEYAREHTSPNLHVRTHGIAEANGSLDHRITIAPGVHMPVANEGACYFPIKEDPNETVAVAQWIARGGRGVDTALMYNNQEVVGWALGNISRPKLRAEVFVTSKIPCVGSSEEALALVKADIQQLRVEQVDLMLIHSPGALGCPRNKTCCTSAAEIRATWVGLESALRLNLTRAIGVSNFEVQHIKAVTSGSRVGKVVPAINQCQMHVGHHDDATIAYGKTLGITYEAFSPLGPYCPLGTDPDCGKAKSVLHNPIVLRIAKSHNRSAAEVGLRWIVQQEHAFVTASAKASYDDEDISGVFDFTLTEAEMVALSAINTSHAS
eukprot:SAG31_NODE_19_length_35031_cov_42.510707_17_plen_865_part_00